MLVAAALLLLCFALSIQGMLDWLVVAGVWRVISSFLRFRARAMTVRYSRRTGQYPVNFKYYKFIRREGVHLTLVRLAFPRTVLLPQIE